jgi:hypothetical protein
MFDTAANGINNVSFDFLIP